ncbi:hypothetical protein MicvaDRAFT_1950 [Microcoleus vaginatus FGP-2]|nr:hypothetical protein MicvaDRAFT_1950 [Microcoleus vaginatus FGP-2]
MGFYHLKYEAILSITDINAPWLYLTLFYTDLRGINAWFDYLIIH